MSKEIKIEKNFSVRLKGSYVYIHRRKSNNEVFYVGKGVNHRWSMVFDRNRYWKNVAFKHGVYCDIVANSLTDNEAFLLEKKLISIYGRLDQKTGTLTNLTEGGDGVVGYVFTEEHRRKMSENSKKQYHSPERRLKMSLRHKGKVMSEETRKKLSESRTGYKMTEEAKLSLRPFHDSLQVKVLCVETGIIYDSMVLAAQAVNGCGSCISKVCQMKRKKHKNFTWSYLPQDTTA